MITKKNCEEQVIIVNYFQYSKAINKTKKKLKQLVTKLKLVISNYII